MRLRIHEGKNTKVLLFNKSVLADEKRPCFHRTTVSLSWMGRSCRQAALMKEIQRVPTHRRRVSFPDTWTLAFNVFMLSHELGSVFCFVMYINVINMDFRIELCFVCCLIFYVCKMYIFLCRVCLLRTSLM